MNVDPSEGYISCARDRVTEVRVRLEVEHARSLSCDTASFGAAVSELVLKFVPEPAQAVSAMKRLARSRGAVAAYVWHYAGKMELMRYFWDAAVALNPTPTYLMSAIVSPCARPNHWSNISGK